MIKNSVKIKSKKKLKLNSENSNIAFHYIRDMSKCFGYFNEIKAENIAHEPAN